VYKEFFPDVAVGYKDPRVKLHIIDGTSKLHGLVLSYYSLKVV